MSTRERERRQRQRQANFEARLGWRIDEWVELTGTSRPTVGRRKAGTLKITYIGNIPIIPRTEAIRLGLIQS